MTAATTQATTTYHHNIVKYLNFTEWRTTTSQHSTMRLSCPLNTPSTAWNTQSPQIHTDTTSQRHTPRQYITEFCKSIRLKPFSVTSTDNAIMALLDTYDSPLILTIDWSFKPPDTHHIYPPRQPQYPTLAHTAASVTITTINNSHPTTQWMDLPIIPLLSRVQPLPAAYGTNNVTNSTAEILTRVMACELLPENTPAIIIYDSAIFHSQYLALLGHTYTNRQRTRTV